MLYLVATPIGNREDITLRALRVLDEVDCILAEDTRRTGLLLKQYGIKKKPFYSLHQRNEKTRTEFAVKELKKGRNIALVTNAGCPLVSDPGYTLVDRCRDEQIAVTAVPGASALITAAQLAGVRCDRFVFLGFLPRKKGARKRLLNTYVEIGVSLVLFESPYRVTKLMVEIGEIFGQVRCALVREMTKAHEEVIRGSPSELLNWLQALPKIRGEYTVVIEGFPKKG